MPEANASVAAAVTRIRAALGPAGCLEAPAEVEPFLVDFRALYRGATPLVACPATTAEVAAVLAICNELGVGVVPHGGNTSYCGGATPGAAGDQVVLSLRRMNRIRAVDAANFSLVAEAGCVLADVQSAAEAAGRLFPLSLGSRRQLPDRRQPLDQCGRPGRGPLRRGARPRAGPRGGAGRRSRPRRLVEPAQGQHRLRPARSLRRRRGHARRDHRGESQAVSAAAHGGDGFRRGARHGRRRDAARPAAGRRAATA